MIPLVISKLQAILLLVLTPSQIRLPCFSEARGELPIIARLAIHIIEYQDLLAVDERRCLSRDVYTLRTGPSAQGGVSAWNLRSKPAPTSVRLQGIFQSAVLMQSAAIPRPSARNEYLLQVPPTSHLSSISKEHAKKLLGNRSGSAARGRQDDLPITDAFPLPHFCTS
jgi:hypothetical protein